MANRSLERAAVLMFHGLILDETKAEVPVRQRKYWINARQFSRQLQEIAAAGYHVQSLDAFWHGANIEGASSGRSTVVTFDDGTASDYEIAFPRLLEAGAPASFFLNTANVGTPGYLTWSEAREMQKHGMTFYSHGHEHVYLTRLDAAALAFQLRRSRQMLEDNLGRPVDFFSPPFGDCNKRLLEASRAAGYKAVCTSRSLRARPGQPTVNRVAVYADSGPETIRRMITGNSWFYAGRLARAILIRVPKQIILTKEYAS